MHNTVDLPHERLPLSEFEEFYDSALCGYVTTDNTGKIVRFNKRITEWVTTSDGNLIGDKITALLSNGSRILFETHLWPLIRMQGYFDEMAVEFKDTGKGKLPFLMNGYVGKRNYEQAPFIHFTLFRATDRKLYEDNLQLAKRLAESELAKEQENAVIREQFIAVLGHDLRNPLGAIKSVGQILSKLGLNAQEKRLIEILQTSTMRMSEMIENVMDFARGRLGQGIPVDIRDFELKKFLFEVVEEARAAWPERNIVVSIKGNEGRVHQGDVARLSQLISNLLANAITHGNPEDPVKVEAIADDTYWEISVVNSGTPIPQEYLPLIFQPFQREKSKSSQNGLGLGLYIASEIAKAHQGKLLVHSDIEKTQFTLRIQHKL